MANVRKQQAGGDDVAAKQAEEARRIAEELRKAAEAAERARQAAEAARLAKEAAAKANSKMEPERKIGRVVRESVRFEVAKKLPQQRVRASVKLELQSARADRVKAAASVEASKVGVITNAWVAAVKKNDVGKMEQLALPRLEKVAMRAADLVDGVQQGAVSAAAMAVKSGLSAVAGEAAKVVLSGNLEGLKGRAKWGAEGLKEMMPRLADQVAQTQAWAEQGLELGDLKSTVTGVRKQLADMTDTVGTLHAAADSVKRLSGGTWDGASVKKALTSMDTAMRHTDVQLTVAEGRARFAEAHAVGQVNDARGATGYQEIAHDAAPEQWMPRDGEHPDAAHVRKSDDPGSEVARLSAKLEQLKAKQAGGENVTAQIHSVKANLRAAEAALESGATSLTGETAVEGAEESQLPPGVTMGPDGVPVDASGMPLQLSEADLQQLGTGLPAEGAPQVMWTRNDGFPEGTQPGALPSQFAGKAREQGLITPDQVKTSQDLANKTVSGEEVRKFEAGDMALLAKQAGIPLEKMDPNQLAQAAKLVSGGKTAQEQRDCISVAVQNLQMIAGGKPPQFNRDEMKSLMWAHSKLPGHALDKVSDSELGKKFQEAAGATNAPGEHTFKIGKYNTTIKVAEDGGFESSKCKKPSLLSKIVKIAKIVTKIAAVVPGPWQPFALVACAAMAAYDAIKAKSLFGVVTAVASVCGPIGMAASRIATGIKSVADGIKTWKSGGSFLGGLAQVAGGVAGAFGAKLGAWGDRLQKFSQGVGAADRIIQSNKAVGQAKQALEQARASGDAAAISDAMKGLEEAERGKRSAILGAGATALSMAAGAKGKGKDGAKADWQVALSAGASAMRVGQGINDKNLMGAAVEGLSMAADLRDGTKAPRADGFDALRQGASVARGLNGVREGEKAQAAAKQGLERAEAGLTAARRSGDPARIREAEAQVRAARSGLGDAIGGNFNALIGARDAVGGAVSSWNTAQEATRARAAAAAAAAAAAQEPEVMLLPVRSDIDLSQLQVPGVAGEASTPAGADPANPANPESVSWDDYRRGVNGEDVKTVQRRLAEGLGIELEADGQFGPRTEAAVREFQRANGLEPDGIVGPRTLQALGLGVQKPSGEVVEVRGTPGVRPGNGALPSVVTTLDGMMPAGRPTATLPQRAATLTGALDTVQGSSAYGTLSPEQQRAFDQAWNRLAGANAQGTNLRAMQNLVGSLESGQLSDPRGAGQRAVDDYLRMTGDPASATDGGYTNANGALYLASGSGGLPSTSPGGRAIDVESALELAMGIRREIRSTNTVSGATDYVFEELYHRFAGDLDPANLGTEGVRRQAGLDQSLMRAGTTLPDLREEAYRAARNLAAASTERQWGNCQELAAIAATRLHDRGVGNVEILARAGNNGASTHAFVVVGRAPGSNPADPRTWGPNAMVVDPWASNGRAYPANRLSPSTLSSSYPLPGVGELELKFRLPDPGVKR